MKSALAADALDTSALLKILIAFKEGDFPSACRLTTPGSPATSPTPSMTSSS
jgi:hypothetical protein